MRSATFGVIAALTFATANVASAQVTQTIGAGSAVTNVQATASFESQNALNDNPYTENGLVFTRTNMTFDNNGCGFAGCLGAPGFAGVQGNYMYGNGEGGYFSMFAPTGQLFKGLEFIAANGYYDSGNWNVGWSAWKNGSLVGEGSLNAFTPGDIVGFASDNGFDELRYSDLNGLSAAAFDEVHAQFDGTQVVPEPSTWALMASGLLVVGGFARRKRITV